MPSGARQRGDTSVIGLGQVERPKGGEGAASRGVDGERGPRRDGDGPSSERGEPLDAPPSRAGRAVAFEGRAGGAVDGAGVGSCFERGVSESEEG